MTFVKKQVGESCFLNLFSLIPRPEKTGKDGAANAVPGTRDGTRQNRQRLCGEERASQNGGQACILHTHLNRYRAFLGGVEACQLT